MTKQNTPKNNEKVTIKNPKTTSLNQEIQTKELSREKMVQAKSNNNLQIKDIIFFSFDK